MRISKIAKPVSAIFAIVSTANSAPVSVNDSNVFNISNVDSLNSDELVSIQTDFNRFDAESTIGEMLILSGIYTTVIFSSTLCPAPVTCVPLSITSGVFLISGAVFTLHGILGNINRQSIERGDGGIDERFGNKIESAEIFQASGLLNSNFNGSSLDGSYNGWNIKEMDIVNKFSTNYHGSKVKRLWVMDNWVFRHRDVKNLNGLSVEDINTNSTTFNVEDYVNATTAADNFDGITNGFKKTKKEITKGIDQVKDDYKNDGAKNAIKKGIDRIIERYPQPAFAVFYESDAGLHVSVALRRNITPDELIDLILSTEPTKPLGVHENGENELLYLTYSFNVKETGFYNRINEYLSRVTIPGAPSTEDISAAGIKTDYIKEYIKKFTPIPVNSDREEKPLEIGSFCGAVGFSKGSKPAQSGEFYVNSFGPVEDVCNLL